MIVFDLLHGWDDHRLIQENITARGKRLEARGTHTPLVTDWMQKEMDFPTLIISQSPRLA